MSLPLVILAVVFGAAVGAFVPRAAHRLAVPHGTAPRSACAVCSRPFPDGFAGWVRAGPSCVCVPRPWATVAGAAAAAGLLGATVGATALLPVLLLAVVPAVLLVAIDLRCLRLPDPVVAAFAVLVALPTAASAVAAGEPARLGRALLAAVLVGSGYLIVALLPAGGLGLGDVKLATVLGFLLGSLGWPAVAVGVLVPQLINGPIALFLLVTRRAKRRTAIPFGPALLLGALAAVTMAA